MANTFVAKAVLETASSVIKKKKGRPWKEEEVKVLMGILELRAKGLECPSSKDLGEMLDRPRLVVLLVRLRCRNVFSS